MSKKNKKDKVKKVKDKSKVEERLKNISNIQVPDQNDFKMDNENNIDRFMRFNRPPKAKLPKKVLNRLETKNR